MSNPNLGPNQLPAEPEEDEGVVLQISSKRQTSTQSEDEQRARVLARPGMTGEKFAQILTLQVPDAEKRSRADHVIDTGTSLAETRHAVQALVHRIIGRGDPGE